MPESRVESAYSQRLKLKCDELLSRFAFNFNLLPYTEVRESGRQPAHQVLGRPGCGEPSLGREVREEALEGC